MCVYIYIYIYIFFSETRSESCGNCINARLCMSSGVTYLNFSVLFNRSLSPSPCELYSNIAPIGLTERRCVELSSNMNYSIVCPICEQQEVYYKIPNNAFFNIEDCSDSGTYLLMKHVCTYTICMYISLHTYIHKMSDVFIISMYIYT